MQELPRHNSAQTTETPFTSGPPDAMSTGGVVQNPYAHGEITAPGGAPEPGDADQPVEQGSDQEDITEVADPTVAPQFDQPLQAMLEELRDHPTRSDAAYHLGMLAAGDNGEVNEHVLIRFFP